MANELRALGRFELLRDNQPVKLREQVAVFLATLAAQPEGVSHQDLVEELWGEDLSALDDEHKSHFRQRLADVVRDARKVLGPQGGGLVSADRQRHVYRLKADADAIALDYVHFERLAREGEQLAEANRFQEAVAAFERADNRWFGRPFELPRASEPEPRSGLLQSKRGQLEQVRRAMLRQWVRTLARQLGRGRGLGQPLERLERLTAGLPGEDLPWFLRFLAVLHEEGPGSALQCLSLWAEVVDPPQQPRLRQQAACLLQVVDAERPRPPPELPDLDPTPGGIPLVGRRKELEELRRFAEAAAQGRRRVCFLQGDGGVGKTRLLAELCILAREMGVRTMAVTCLQAPAGFAPWREVLGPLWVEALQDVQASGLVSGRPDLLGRLLDLDPSQAPPPQVGDITERGHLAKVVAAILEHAGPLLIVVDDAQRIDSASLDLLRELVDGALREKVSVAVALRDAEIERDGALAHWRDALRVKDTPVIEIQPLELEEVGEWLAHTYGRRPTSQELSVALRTTAGYPYSLCDYSETVRLRGGAPVEHSSVERLRPALARLDESCRAWLEAAAVTTTGQILELRLVQEMLGLSVDEADQCLDEARRIRIITAQDPPRFRHEPWRDLVLDDLQRRLGTRRVRELHALAFEVLHRRIEMSRGGPSDQLARLVHHALAGAPLVAPGEVATACLAAAQAARQRNAYRLAVQHCKDGRQLAEDPSHRFALLLELGDASRDAGELAESDAAYLEAEEFARTHSKPRWQALAALRLARRWWIPGRTDHELRQRLELALAALDEGAWELRAQLQAHIANALATGGGDVERRERLAAAALAVVDHCVDPLVRCEILTACWHGRYESRSPTELLTLSRRLKEASRETESIHFRGEGLVTNLVDLVRVGDFAEARQTLGEHRELAERTVQPRALYLQASMDGMMAMWRGDFVEVPVHLAAMAEHGELLHSDMVTQVQIAQYGWFQRELGRADELVRQEDAVRQAVGQSTDIPIWRAALALLLVETARYPDCYWVLNGILRDFDDLSAFPPHGWAVPTLALIAEVCEGLHRAHQADQAPFDLRRLLYELDELLAPHLGEVALAGWPAVLVGPIARYAGLVALALDKPSLAQERLLAAMPLVETSPPNRARVAFDLGRALLRDPANDRDAGRQFLDQARRQAEDLNMEQLATQAQTALTAT